MQADIRAFNFTLTQAIQQHVLNRLSAAVGHIHDRIANARVRVNDLNGPRGGLDKRCQVHLSLVGRGTIVIEQIDCDLYAAIDKATARLRQTLHRRFDRMKKRAFYR